MANGQRDERPLPAHPYRDSAIVYGVMAVILVVLAGVTGGSLVKATGAAIVFWFAACAWSWWKFRRRIRERELEAAAAAVEAGVTGLGVTGPGVAGAREAGAEESPSPGGGRANGSVNGAISGNGNRSGRGRDAGPRGTEP
jgi:Flp pilus assembly protein TadB